MSVVTLAGTELTIQHAARIAYMINLDGSGRGLDETVSFILPSLTRLVSWLSISFVPYHQPDNALGTTETSSLGICCKRGSTPTCGGAFWWLGIYIPDAPPLLLRGYLDFQHERYGRRPSKRARNLSQK